MTAQTQRFSVRTVVALILVGVFSLSALTVLVALICLRYARLLSHTRRALSAPQQLPDTSVPHTRA